MFFSFKSRNNNNSIKGTWFECELVPTEIGDTITFQKDSCLAKGKPTWEYQRQWDFNKEEQFEELYTASVLQTGGRGTWKIKNNKILITRNYTKGPHLQKFKIITLDKKKLKVVVLKI